MSRQSRKSGSSAASRNRPQEGPYTQHPSARPAKGAESAEGNTTVKTVLAERKRGGRR